MRMLFPLEFRIDSLENCDPALPFHYPFAAGEMIYLPERVEPFGTPGAAYNYYFTTTAHLAARHDFGTFALQLADIPGFEERGETGIEAIDAFVEGFDDPALAGALMRLMESARIDAELARRYRGLAPKIADLNRALMRQLHPESISTMLVWAALGMISGDGTPAHPLRSADGGAILRSRARARRGRARQHPAGERPLRLDSGFDRASPRGGPDSPLSPEDAERMRNDLIKGMKGADAQAGAEGEDGEPGEGGGEPDQNVRMEASGRQAKGGKGRALSPEELRKLIEQGAEIKPADGGGEATAATGCTSRNLPGSSWTNWSGCASSWARSDLSPGRAG